MTYNLNPVYDSRASFYGKARVEEDADGIKLISYTTNVAKIKDGVAYVYGTYSQTTLRHIKDFLQQHGFKADNSKQILKDYGSKQPEEPEDTSSLKTVAAVMALGDIFGSGQKEQNDWKTRMLRAGLEGRGLIMPDDWDQLTEDQKTDRLNNVIQALGE